MKTRIFVLMCAVVAMSACGGSTQSSHNHEGHDHHDHAHAAEVKKIISAQVFIKAEKVDAFLALSKDLIEKSRAEAGCISYSLYQDPDDKTKFLIFEEWKNQAAVDFHFATEHFIKLGEILGECASAPAIITIYDSIAETTV